jgi:hypothetical protein
MTDKKFTVAGITSHSNGTVTVDKVRFSTDLYRSTKMLCSNKKIGLVNGGYLDSKRVDLVQLPNEMTKVEACQYLMTLPEFQSPEDQALIQETIGNKSPKDKKIRTPKIPKVRATVGTLMSKKKKSIDTYEKLITALAG